MVDNDSERLPLLGKFRVESVFLKSTNSIKGVFKISLDKPAATVAVPLNTRLCLQISTDTLIF